MHCHGRQRSSDAHPRRWRMSSSPNWRLWHSHESTSVDGDRQCIAFRLKSKQWTTIRLRRAYLTLAQILDTRRASWHLVRLGVLPYRAELRSSLPGPVPSPHPDADPSGWCCRDDKIMRTFSAPPLSADTCSSSSSAKPRSCPMSYFLSKQPIDVSLLLSYNS